MNKTVVMAGHVCLDIIPEIHRDFALTPGHLIEIGPAVTATGGAISNTGVACHILGLPTVLMGKIGNDHFGHCVLDIFRRYGETLVDGMTIVPGETTSYTVVVNVPGSDRSFLHCPGANETFSAEDVAYDKLRDAALFHFGYPPLMRATIANDGESLEKMFRHVKDLGVTTSMDMVMPDPHGPSGQLNWEGILDRVLPLTDIFLPSADELLYMIDRDNFGQGDNLGADQVSDVGQRLIDAGVAIGGVKLGTRGLYVRTANADRIALMGPGRPDNIEDWCNRELWFPVYEIESFASAAGAGDTTIAGFFAAVLRGLDIEQAGAVANMVGALNVQAPDATSGIKPWDETLAIMTNSERAELRLEGDGWQFDSKAEVWRGPNDRRS